MFLSMSTSEGPKEAIAKAEKLLDRLLQWIGRFDTRTSLIVGICVAMLGVLASVSPALSKWTVWLWIAFALSCALITGSLTSLYLGLFPRTASPNSSLIYFGTIAEMKADQFRHRIRAQSDSEYLDDLADQSHINACILARKFFWLKVALAFLLSAAFPWAVTIFLAKHLSSELETQCHLLMI